ncbi:dihydrodipicolinate synthase family protein [Pseudomonas sp. Irchel s3b2]|uniref:dihydrodipicolinate synthase family protein n=1 Tax=Pseudomonas sp. Irchel s3b2 TaxID=2009073 RepID=UPI001C4559CE
MISRLPIIGYNAPQAVGVEVTPDLHRKLCLIPGFSGVKDSSGDLGKQASLIRTGLPVMNGADPFGSLCALCWLCRAHLGRCEHGSQDLRRASKSRHPTSLG